MELGSVERWRAVGEEAIFLLEALEEQVATSGVADVFGPTANRQTVTGFSP